MKKLLLGLLMLLSCSLFAQSSHTVDFETAATGSGWNWTTFEFAPSLTEISNPVSGGINTSSTVMEFIAYATDQPWAGCWTEDDGEFTFDATNSTVTIMVYKPVISEVHFKVEGGTGPVTELIAINTLTNAWEELTFDFSAVEGETYNRIVIFPDFAARTVDHTIYFDNIVVPDGVVTVDPEPTTVPAIPTHASEDVVSIYSDSYTDISGTNFSPYWGQTTTVTVNYVAAGNNTLKYANFNYQGTEFSSAQDLSSMEYIHIDLWTPDATVVKFSPISQTTGEFLLDLTPINQGSWNSYDIPLTDFTGISMANIFQLKFDGQTGVSPSTVYLDNIYFWKNPTASGTDATLSDLKVNGTTIAGFSPGIENYTYDLEEGTVIVPQITDAIPNDPNVFSIDINQATSIPGDATVVVTAEDETTTKTYTVSFAITIPNSTPPTPTANPSDVISIYSDEYTNITGVDFNPFWGQLTVVTVDDVIAGNNTLKYENLNYQGTDFDANHQDVSTYETFHLDYWSANATSLDIYLISPGPVETPFSLPINPGTWQSVDIPLTAFAPVNLADIFQIKVVGNGDVWFDNWYFEKSGAAGSVVFDPLDGATGVAIDINPTLTFSAPIVMADGSSIEIGDIPSIITFKETDALGANVPFIGSINVSDDVLTVYPNSDLSNNQQYYLALNNEIVKFQSGSLIPGESVTFTTIQAVALDLYDNFEDPTPLTWGYWDNQQGGILDINAANPSPSPFGGNPSTTVAKFTKEASSDPYTHAFAILGGKLDLSFNNQFKVLVYSESPSSVFTFKLQNNDLLEPWTTEVGVDYTIQAPNTWELATFDFSPHSDRTDLDKILIMVDAGSMGVGVHYFDEIYGSPFTPPAASPVVVGATTNDDGTMIEVQFDKDMEPEPSNEGNFNLYADGVMIPVTSTARSTTDFTVIELNIATPVEPGDVLLLSYLMSGTVTSADNGVLQPFQDFSVTNTLMTELDLTVILEGPFNGFNMFASLNSILPLSQPYNTAPWNYAGTETVGSIPNTNVVDWVLIEIRDAADASLATPATMVDQQAAFLLRNGSVVGLDGISNLIFDVNINDGLFVMIWHRNHLQVLSASELVRINGVYEYNFASSAGMAYEGKQKELSFNLYGMYSGNGSVDAVIDDLDIIDGWESDAGSSGYQQGDFNMDGEVDNSDKNDYWYENVGATITEYQLIWSDEFDVDGAPAPEN